MKMHFATPHPTADIEMSAEEQNRCRLLSEMIRAKIRSSDHEAIPFSSYMNLVLYAPNYGYYTSAGYIVGARGDFITAPEMGDIFGTILATKIADSCAMIEHPPTLYEFGAGNGTLAAQILRELNRLGVEIEKYEIIEVSPMLKAIQQDTFSRAAQQISQKVSWREHLPESGIEGLVIANEVVDAMPVELLLKAGDQFRQGFVVEADGGFDLEYRTPVQPNFRNTIDALNLPDMGDGYFSEIHCHAEAWLRTLAEMMNTGSILITDYGFPEHEYYHHDRKQGTLVCHRRHRLLFDPFSYLGCQDITAHVNFSALARVAVEAGMEVNGFTNLGSFIVDIGMIGGILDQVTEKSVQYATQFDKLSSPNEMGEIFKVMELTKNFDSTGLGFNLSDRTHRLGISDSVLGLAD